MADNYVANAGAGGDTFAADEIGVAKFPRIKLIHGADGVNAGDVAAANPLPVVQTGALPAGTNNIGDVDVLTLPALPAGANNIGDVDVLTLPALPAGTNNIGDVDVLTLPAASNAGATAKTSDYDTGAGTDTVTMFGVALPASGGAVAGGTSTNPLRTDPTGTTTQPVSGTVTANAGSGTFTVSGTVTANAGSGTLTVQDNASKIDDAAFTPATDRVLMIGAEADETAPDAVDEGDAGALRMTLNRALHINVRDDAGDSCMDGGNNAVRVNVVAGSAGGPSKVDDAAFAIATDSVAPMGALADETTPDSVDEGDVGIPRMTLTRKLYSALADPVAERTATVRDTGTNDSLNVAIVDAAGNQITSFGGSGGTSHSDDAAFTIGSASSVTPFAALADETTPDSVDEGDVGVVRMTLSRKLLNVISDPSAERHATVRDTGTNDSLNVAIVDASGNQITSFGGGTQFAEDAAHTSGDVGTMALAVRRDTAASGTSADGDYATLNVNSSGRLYTSATIDAALPAGTNNIGDVDVLTLPALAAGTNNIGDVDVLSFAAGAIVEVQGDVAHDAAVSGNPVLTGLEARTSSGTAVANGDAVRAMADTLGKQVVLPYANPENFIRGVTAAITGTADTAVIAAQGAGVRIYVTSLFVQNSHATVDTLVEIKDGTTVIDRIWAGVLGGGAPRTYLTPLRLTANTALNAANVTTGANVYVSAQGYAAP